MDSHLVITIDEHSVSASRLWSRPLIGKVKPPDKKNLPTQAVLITNTGRTPRVAWALRVLLLCFLPWPFNKVNIYTFGEGKTFFLSRTHKNTIVKIQDRPARRIFTLLREGSTDLRLWHPCTFVGAWQKKTLRMEFITSAKGSLQEGKTEKFNPGSASRSSL